MGCINLIQMAPNHLQKSLAYGVRALSMSRQGTVFL